MATNQFGRPVSTQRRLSRTSSSSRSPTPARRDANARDGAKDPASADCRQVLRYRFVPVLANGLHGSATAPVRPPPQAAVPSAQATQTRAPAMRPVNRVQGGAVVIPPGNAIPMGSCTCHSAATSTSASVPTPPGGASPQMERCLASPLVPAMQRISDIDAALTGQAILQAERAEPQAERAALLLAHWDMHRSPTPARSRSPDGDQRNLKEGWVFLRRNYVVDEIRRLQQELDMLERVVHRARHATAACP